MPVGAFANLLRYMVSCMTQAGQVAQHEPRGTVCMYPENSFGKIHFGSFTPDVSA